MPGPRKNQPAAPVDELTRREQEKFERKRRARKERIKFGQPVQKLGLSQKQQDYFERRGEVVHWFNDEPGRLTQAEGQDYRFVTKDEIEAGGIGKEGDPTVVENVGERISRVVGTKDNGDPILSYLMAIPKEFYEDDQKAKSEKLLEKERAIMQGIDGQGRPGVDGRELVKHTPISMRRGR